jgi:type III pantothenate kinase
MKLLIDIGNTRLKWALWNGADLQFGGAAVHDDFSDAAWPDLPTVDSIWAASVASAGLNERLATAVRDRFALTARFVHSRTHACGVRNAYAQPERLGVDRFLALVAAPRPGTRADDRRQLRHCADS